MSSHLNPIDPLDRWSIATRGFGGPLRIVDSANKTVCREVRSLSDAWLLSAAPAMLSALKDMESARERGFDLPWGTVRAALARAGGK